MKRSHTVLSFGLLAGIAAGVALAGDAPRGDPAPTLLAPTSLTPQEQLGKLLFFDEDLSTPPGQSCAACHGPAVGFTGPVEDINLHGGVYPGAVHTRFGNRKPPSAAYAWLSPPFHYDEVEGLYIGGQFWDGRARDLVEQAKGPYLNRVEQNNPHARQVVIKVRNSDYADLFEEVYGEGSLNWTNRVTETYQHIAEAVAAYEASEEVNPFTSKYDYYLAGEVDLTEQEARGLELFEGRAMCSACHPSRPTEEVDRPLFTDFTYDNLGVPRNPENPWYDMPRGFNRDGEDWIDWGLGAIVDEDNQLGKVKVPTLRNVDKRPHDGFVKAFTHNGYFTSLLEVVHFYNTRDVLEWPPPEVAENVNTDELGNLGLTAVQEEAIVAFMKTLSDGYVP